VQTQVIARDDLMASAKEADQYQQELEGGQHIDRDWKLRFERSLQ
jgi:hypothetical protein